MDGGVFRPQLVEQRVERVNRQIGFVRVVERFGVEQQNKGFERFGALRAAHLRRRMRGFGLVDVGRQRIVFGDFAFALALYFTKKRVGVGEMSKGARPRLLRFAGRASFGR